MIRNKNRVTRRKGGGRRSGGIGFNNRLTELSARLDSARNARVTRKPVFNRSLEVVAYEVVLGDGPVSHISVGEGGRRLVVNEVTELDLDAIGGGKTVQLPVASSIIESGLPSDLAPEQVMLLLGSGVDASVATITALENTRRLGYRIVLDDLTTYSRLHPLLRLAHGVKINTGIAPGPTVAKQIAILKTSGVELMADGIGTYDDLRNATRQGFTQFQGSFLSRPDGFRKTRAPAGQLAGLELITLLQNPDAEISEIATVIRRDVNLSYRILKVVNSAHYSLPRPLGSIEEAVMLVGVKQIVSWVGMLSMSGLNDKPSELTRCAMVRARVCEILAEYLDRSDVPGFYLVGLFSVIEALLDVPAARALGSLPLNADIADAIVSGGGIMGEVLRGVLAYERGDWGHAHIIGLDDSAITYAFYLAIIEVDEVWTRIAG